MNKVYKTANGQLIDIDRMRLTNETTEAVGNMQVNARGDEIDSQGNIIRTRNEIMREFYKDNNQNKDK